jgi:hypothetical protein
MIVVLIRARAQCAASLPQVEFIRTAPRFQLTVGVMRMAKSRSTFSVRSLRSAQQPPASAHEITGFLTLVCSACRSFECFCFER